MLWFECPTNAQLLYGVMVSHTHEDSDSYGVIVV